MAEGDNDDSQKTEEPTQKRLDEARSKGDVPTSREVQNWFMLVSATIVVAGLLPHVAGELTRTLTAFIAHPQAFAFDRGSLGIVFDNLILHIALALAAPIGLFVVAAAASGLLQHGVIFTTEKMKPSLEKISPIGGFKRMFSLRSLAELVKGLLKIAVVAVVAWIVIKPVLPRLSLLPSAGIGNGMTLLHDMATHITFGTVIALTFVAMLDYLYQRFEHTKKLRMSKQEVRDEYKQMEGDPQVKARLRSIRMERSRQRMMQAVPEADVVVTNPTHFAVALKYDQATMEAPKVIAKGVDSLAFRIREKAESCDITIVENPPLARALYGTVEVDEAIKPEHYQAVAEIIAFVMGIGGARRPGSGRPAPVLTR